MDDEQLRQAWLAEEAATVAGRGLSHLDGRWEGAEPPWNYDGSARELIGTAQALLDIGAGDGRPLLALLSRQPPSVVATERSAPSFEQAARRLGERGIQVFRVEPSLDQKLPFASGAFDLALSRNSVFNVAEVRRVLRPSGVLLTQQGDGHNPWDLASAFETVDLLPFFGRDYFSRLVESVGLHIERTDAWEGELRFGDVGAIVYFLNAMPWVVPNFSVERFFPQLLKLEQQLATQHRLVFHQRLFLIQARKPKD